MRSRVQSVVQRRGIKAALILALIVAAVFVPPHFPPFLLTVLLLSLGYAILAMSLDVLMGYAGMESLGQAAFFGVAAYAAGILIARYHQAWPIAVLVGLGLGTAAAAVAGLLAVRLRGLFFLVITLAFAQVLWGISNRWGQMTNGYVGLRGPHRPYSGLDSDVNFYYVVLAVFIVAAFGMRRLVTSPFGLGLKGIRESESRMKTTGYNVWLHKYIAFVICGAFAALAGVVYAFTTQFVTPGVLSITTSFDAMLMVILGGVGTLVGPAIGAVALVGLRNYLSSYVDHWIIILGAIYILTVLFAPKGVVGFASGLWKRQAVPEEEEQAAVPEEAADEPQTPQPVAAALRAITAESTAPQGNPHQVAALQVTNLAKAFGTIHAVQDVSITADVGTRLAILGPNGAGKTTLFNLISGLYKPSSGDISLFGRSMTRVPPHARAHMGLGRTYQITNLYSTLTVSDNIRLGILGTRAARYAVHSPVAGLSSVNERSKELLKAIGLWERRDMEVRHLSYGHQRQLEIVMALASEPRVLLLDEPAAGLSVAETKRMVELIRSLDPALTLLIIEHDMDVAFELATEIVVLHNGRLLARGSREEIRANSAVRDVYLGHAYA
jgi:ABC-type branched-subunit amino acid transport system ATPase component/ABC-type branched-subunit amino acid transport system permease subunit